MQREVRGADRVTGRDQTLLLEADDEASAMRRGARRGLVVEWARPLDPDDSVAGAAAVAVAAVPEWDEAAPAHGGGDTVGYAYVVPEHSRRRRRKSGAGAVLSWR